jgi:hypothetical protein
MPRPLPAPAVPVTRHRGVYRVRSDRPGFERWQAWTSDGRLLADSYLAPSVAHADTRRAFYRWLDAEDPLPVPARALTLVHGGLARLPVGSVVAALLAVVG